ncbi:MAG TPA: hypothetical protein PLH57_01695 [Oligoflexia bacterium]|nr:hypothetical protein [Oligoflexia bacterium]
MKSVYFLALGIGVAPLALAQTAPAPNPGQQASIDQAAVTAGELSVCEGALHQIGPSQATIQKAGATMMGSSQSFGGANFNACAMQGLQQTTGSAANLTPDQMKAKLVVDSTLNAAQVANDFFGAKNSGAVCSLTADPYEDAHVANKYLGASCDSFRGPATRDGKEGTYSEAQLMDAIRAVSEEQGKARCEIKRVAAARQSLECFQSNYEKVRASMLHFRDDLDDKRECVGSYITEVEGLAEKQKLRATELDERVRQFSQATARAQEMLDKIQEKEPQLNEAIPTLRQERARLYSALRSDVISKFHDCVNGDAAYNSPLRRSRCLERSPSGDGRKGKFERVETRTCLVNRYNEYSGGNSKENIDKDQAGDKSSLFSLDLENIDSSLMGELELNKPNLSDSVDVLHAIEDASGALQKQDARLRRLEEEYGSFGKAYASQFRWCMANVKNASQKEYNSETGTLAARRMDYESKVREVASDFRATAKAMRDTVKSFEKTLGVDLTLHLNSHHCGSAVQNPGKSEGPATLDQRKECINHLTDLVETVKSGSNLPDSNGGLIMPIPGVIDTAKSPECRGLGAGGCVCTGLEDCADKYGKVSSAITQNVELMKGKGHYVDPSCTTMLCVKKPGAELAKEKVNASISKAIQAQGRAYAGIAQGNQAALAQLNALLSKIPGAGRLGGFDPTAQSAFSCAEKDEKGICAVPDDLSAAVGAIAGMPVLSNEAFETRISALANADSKPKEDQRAIGEVLGRLATLKVSCANQKKKEGVVDELDALRGDLAEAGNACEEYAEMHSPDLARIELAEIFENTLKGVHDICDKNPGALQVARKDCAQFKKEIGNTKRECGRYITSREEARRMGYGGVRNLADDNSKSAY